MKAQRAATIVIILLIGISPLTKVWSQDASEMRIRHTNQHYELGDWIGYSNSRFVNSIAIGIEHIYFATTGGITRYNFYHDRWDFPWTTCNGLAHNKIISVAFDGATNTLWCSTPVGVSYYESFSRLWHNLYYDDMGLDYAEVILSIGFSASNIYLESNSHRQFQRDKQYGDFSYISASANEESVQWFGQRRKNESELPILFMSDGYLFDTRGAISDVNMRRFDVTCYVYDKWGFIWLGTWGLGAGKADTRTQQLELLPFGLMQANVTALTFSEDQFWVGGWDPDYHEGSNWGEENGVTLWNRIEDTWSYYQAKFITEFQNDQALSITLDDLNLWIGVEQGLSEFNQDRNRWYTFTQTEGLRNNTVNDVVVDPDYVWVASPSGIDRLARDVIHSDSIEVTFIAYDDLREVEVFDLEISGDTLWAGTEIGAYFYQISTDSGGFFEGDWAPGTKPVTAVGVSPSAVWFGTEDEIDVFDLKKNKWLPRPYRNTDVNTNVNYIVANEMVVFVATDEGVLKYDRTRDYWKQFTMEDGLIANRVTAIQLEGDYVWFGTENGICRFFWNNPMRID